jgi:hypothetical protein
MRRERVGRERMLRMRMWLLGAVVACGVAAGCTDNCMQIQDQICLCQGQTQEEQSTCQSNASTQESNNPPSNAKLTECAQLLPSCTSLINGGSGCDKLQTDVGRQACGLSPLPDGGL